MALPDRDLGLSGRISQNPRQRVLRQDGSFNIVRLGRPFLQSVNAYHKLLTMPGWGFLGLILLAYFLVNILFALLYVSCGPGAVSGLEATDGHLSFANAFFFSVQTIATIGYGKMVPQSFTANILVSLEALTGLLGFALATGILFARLSRPRAKLLYSSAVLIAPYRGGRALMFRIANGFTNELTDVRATVSFSYMGLDGDARVRKFRQLTLERDSVTFFPTQWVVVHPIDDQSPFHGMTAEVLAASEPEIFILINAMDETFSQTVQSRFSYVAQEFVWGAKFRDVFGLTADGVTTFNLSLLHDYDRIDLA